MKCVIVLCCVAMVTADYKWSSDDYPYVRYAFRPRAIPLRDNFEGRSMLFPGNLRISKEKSDVERTVEVPLLRNGFQKRSLEEPIIERPEFSQVAERRSISDMFSVGEDDDEEDDEELDGEFEEEDVQTVAKKKNQAKKPKLKSHQMKKYMLPLLLAYKMKFFALIPVMIAGLVLLVGSTGLAGFFFALFAAVMALQKGSGY